MHWPSWLTMFPYVGRLTNKLITTTCPQRRFCFDASKGVERRRFWRFEVEDARVKTSFVWWRHRPVIKSVLFYHWYYVNRCTYVVERSVSMVNDFTLNCRHIFNHSVKEHLCYSRYRINTLVANWVFFVFPLFRIKTLLSNPCMD